jgi:hypothetical protein
MLYSVRMLITVMQYGALMSSSLVQAIALCCNGTAVMLAAMPYVAAAAAASERGIRAALLNLPSIHTSNHPHDVD